MKLDLKFNETMPSNVTPLEAVAMVKCLDEEGAVTWYKISTPDLNLMEALGMLVSAVVITEATVKEGFIEDDSDSENKGDD